MHFLIFFFIKITYPYRIVHRYLCCYYYDCCFDDENDDDCYDALVASSLSQVPMSDVACDLLEYLVDREVGQRGRYLAVFDSMVNS